MPEIAGVKIIHEGWGRFLIADIRLDDGQHIRREIEDHGAAVGVLAYDPARRTALLVRQFRAPLFYAIGLEHTLEVIAGGLVGDEPRNCVRREAIEEAGVELRDLEEVATGLTMPGVSTMRIHLYLATYSKANRVGEGGGLAEEREDITVVELGLAEAARWVDAGRCVDLTTAFLIQTLRCRRPELFLEAPRDGGTA